jgi:hypothetical protein
MVIKLSDVLLDRSTPTHLCIILCYFHAAFTELSGWDIKHVSSSLKYLLYGPLRKN